MDLFGGTVLSCLFCGIVAGEVPSETVLESEQVVAFRDVSPAAPSHVLVVPREHIANAHELGREHAQVLAEMLVAAQEGARLEGIDTSGYRLVMNIGDDALNSVPHLHLHVIGGRRMGWPPG
ncbi:MAG: histidine triad nucleotide-binding protein [Actinobacteria bacterium]|nr:histidine triad nucleotide-binding protein [Actinomycetota bacterium]